VWCADATWSTNRKMTDFPLFLIDLTFFLVKHKETATFCHTARGV
jgi:hypothetical protein